MPITPV